MALFQNSVLNKKLKEQDSAAVAKAYKKFTKYFHNPIIQQNIRESKEEQFQEGFLRELFVTVLGYTLNPNPNYNLTTELKNEKGAKKADGAILSRGHDPLSKPVALAVIELKGTKTKDLESIRQQAFDYKANQSGCVYVITSNFEKLRFYINNAVDFEEFNLFTLTKSQFELLYLCLYHGNLLDNIPLKIKEASIQEEEKITKTFYTDYSLFKRALFRDLVKRNLKNEVFRSELNNGDSEQAVKNIKLALFKKSQKLIDRFLFIFFAEDRDLLPPNSTLLILNKWKSDIDYGDERPLYGMFKLYFHFLDTGRRKTDQRAEIFAYNGGLFKPDAVLDSLLISDDLLYEHAKALSNYDFDSQVDVNILGHIFENSLNEIESVNAEIEGTDFDKQKTKRKKDGVFYTPKYITKYIVDNTVGKLCEEKKLELHIKEEEYHSKRQKETKKKLLAALELYRTWLLQLTILDPACGSGAFLNQALHFLIKEHGFIDELQTNLLGGGFVFPNIENTVLENNIFGVDLNEESVEIAKLSLWLSTAQPRRKLNDLSSNIKCGNSLIDSTAVAGDKAFKWEEEFPHIFKEKEKKTFHITTALHDSRTSARMEKYKVREKRALGTNPYPSNASLTTEDDLLITKTIADIVVEDNLKILAYNICGDHIHLLLVCDEDDVSSIMQKIKAVSSRKYNIERGVTTSHITREHAPLSKGKERGEKQHSLWTQKFGSKEIRSEEQLQNTIDYITNNRSKHELPKHRRPLNDIIDAMCCDIDSAFEEEYSGGFDVVIGNPPYVNMNEFPKLIHKYFETEYRPIHTGYNDLMYYFLYKGINLLKKDGVFGVITSNYFIGNDYAKGLRNFLSKHLKLLVNFEKYHVFKDANIHTAILLAEKNPEANSVIFESYKSSNPITEISTNVKGFRLAKIDRDKLTDNWIIADESKLKLINKLSSTNELLGNISEIAKGSESGKNEIFTVNEEIIKQYNIERNVLKKCVKNSDIRAYSISVTNQYLIYSDNDFSKELYPNAFKYLEDNKELLLNRRGPKTGEYEWWRLHRPSIKEVFESDEKILVPYRAEKNRFGYDNQQLFNNGGDIRAIRITNNEYKTKFVTAVLNSALINWFYGFIGKPKGNSREYFNKPLSQIPIVKASEEIQHALSSKVNLIMGLKLNRENVVIMYSKYLQSKFTIEKLQRKLQNWHELDFGEFIKELNKAIKKRNREVATDTTREHAPLSEQLVKPLTKLQEMEWMDVFETKKAEAQTLKAEIDRTDTEIDAIVYALYGLTEEEIKIVEDSNN